VPLKDLEDALAPTTLKVTRKGDGLIVQHENLTTRVDEVNRADLVATSSSNVGYLEALWKQEGAKFWGSQRNIAKIGCHPKPL
jgi:hypothetical protein